MFGLDPAVIALIGTVIGTVGVKVAEKWLGKRDRKVDDATQIRSELREQVTSLKEEILRLEDDVEEWRSKYYDTREELALKRLDLQNALEQIKRLQEQAYLGVEKARKIVDSTMEEPKG